MDSILLYVHYYIYKSIVHGKDLLHPWVQVTGWRKVLTNFIVFSMSVRPSPVSILRIGFAGSMELVGGVSVYRSRRSIRGEQNLSCSAFGRGFLQAASGVDCLGSAIDWFSVPVRGREASIGVYAVHDLATWKHWFWKKLWERGRERVYIYLAGCMSDDCQRGEEFKMQLNES